MWDELETGIKIYSKSKPFFGEGNRDADIMVIFDHVTDKMNEINQIKGSQEYNILKKIFDFVKIDVNKCYYTTLIKYYTENIIENIFRKESMEYLLYEIYLVKPKYIICIGEEIFNHLYKYHEKKDTDKLLIDISKCANEVFDFYGILLIPLFDMSKIKNMTNKQKKEMVDILRGINK